MRKIFLLTIMSICALCMANAQNVTVSGAITGDGSYANLSAAFSAIGTAQSGANITVTISGDVAESTSGASLGAGTWSSLTIVPSGGSWTVSSAVSAGTALLTFNGADNVTINGGGNLIFDNTTSSNMTGTTTLRLQADATNNTFNGVTFVSRSTGSLGSNTGAVLLSTGTTTGNDGNSFQNCKFDGKATGNVGITANGSTSSAAIGNSGTVINNCEFFDFFNAGVASAAIYSGNGTVNFTITNNKVYQTASRTITSAQTNYGFYFVNTTYGDGINITGNTIGYASASGTGTMIYAAGTTSGGFVGILISLLPTATGTSNVNNNTISNIKWTSTGASTFSGIANSQSTATGTNFINVNNNTVGNIETVTTTGLVVAINPGGAGTLNCNNNTVTNISRSGAGVFQGINWATSPNVIISGNTVHDMRYLANTASNFFPLGSGSASVNETIINNTVSKILSTSTGSQTINPINQASTATSGIKIVRGNTVKNILTTTSTGPVRGINTNGGSSLQVSENMVDSLYTNGNLHGIFLNATSGPATVNVYNNRVRNTNTTGSGSQATGIVNNAASSTLLNIYNNIISDIKTPNTNKQDAVFGINITNSPNVNIIHNTIYLGNVTTLTSSGANFGGAGIAVIPTSTNNIIQNNIINVNATKNGDAYFSAVKVSLTNGMPGTAGNVSAGVAMSNNIYNAPNVYGEGYLASTATDIWGSNFTVTANGGGTLANFNDHNSTNGITCSDYKQTFNIADRDSYIENNLSATTPMGAFAPVGNSYANNSATTGDTLATDLANSTRAGGASNDRGALEFSGTTLTNCDLTSTTAGTASGPTTVCTNTSASLTATGFTTGKTGLSYQWMSSTVMGGPYTDISGATNASYTTGNLGVPTYFVFKVICGSCGTGTDFLSNEIFVNLNSLPTVAVSPSSANYCTPGGTAVTLTASGASTYTWSPNFGLSATNVAAPTATPSSTVTYTVTGTDANGCKNTAMATVNVNVSPVISSTTATPSVICSGANSQLLATASVPSTPNLYTYASSSFATFETIMSASSLSTVDNGTTADGSNTIAPSGFTFPFSGTDYTNFFVTTNGAIKLGASPGLFTTVFGSGGMERAIYVFGRNSHMNENFGGELKHGTATGGKYVFEFVNVSGANNTEGANPRYNAQVVLWGSTSTNPGKIEIIYGFSLGTPASAGQIGITNGSTYFNGHTGNTFTNTSATNFPAEGTKYTFTPPGSAITYAWTPTTFIPSGQEATNNPLATAVTTTTNYSVVASANGCSTAPSNVEVTVSAGPSIVTQPGNVAACDGTPSYISIVGFGPSLTYQWKLNGSNLTNGGNISGANSDTLRFAVASIADAGNYTCEISAACGSPVTSNVAVLSIINGPGSVTITPSAPSVCVNSIQALTAASGPTTSTISWSPVTYLYTDAAATMPYTAGTNATTVYVKPTAAGTTNYTALATAFNGCTNSASVTVNHSCFNVTPATPGSCFTGVSATINAGNTNSWVPLMDGMGNIIAAVKGNGNLLGTTTAQVYVHNSSVRSNGATYFLDRNITINVANQPTSNVDVRLYYTEVERAALEAAQPGATVTFSNLLATKNSQTCSSTFMPNVTGEVLLSPVSGAISGNGYYTEYSVAGFSSFFFHSHPPGGGTLPIVVQSVNANITGNTNTISWTTASENNIKKFVVERSVNGSTYISIGEVASQAINGNSTIEIHYSFIDANPVKGKQYYRLRIVDKNERISYSPIVTLRRGGGAMQITDVRPNPSTGIVYFNIIGANNTANIVLRTLNGQQILHKNLVQSSNFNVDLAPLSAGVYILEAVDVVTQEKAVYKLVKK
jgi:hypothetical protein